MQLNPILDQNIINNLPRVNKEFIGISHKLQLRKRQRKQIQLQQKAIANRVLYLSKQQQKAQKNIQNKKQELKKVMTSIQKKNYYKQQKQRLRSLRQLELQTIRQQNKHRRLMHKQSSFNSKFSIYSSKHNSYQIQKSIMSQKEKEKRKFLQEDHRQKKDQWLTINLDKQKGKQRVDRYFKIKNKQYTQNYIQKIEKQQMQKIKKQSTIRKLQYIETALRKKLQESTMKVSQIQERIINTSRTIEPTTLSRSRKNSITNNSKSRLTQHKNSQNRLQQYEKKVVQNSLQNMLEKDLIQQYGSRTQRNTNNEQQIQEKIQQELLQGQNRGFKIIRTKRKNKHKNRYKQYQLF